MNAIDKERKQEIKMFPNDLYTVILTTKQQRTHLSPAKVSSHLNYS